MLNNIKNIKDQKGFTIVELLIVIVVIAILAAITIVAYNGIQNRAKSSSGQSLAANIAKKAEAFNTIQSSYPTTVDAFASGPKEAILDDSGAALSVTTDQTLATFGQTNDAAGANGGKRVAYRYCAASGTGPTAKAEGAVVYWFDYAAPGMKSVKVGGGC